MTQQRERARLWRQHGFISAPMRTGPIKKQFSRHAERYHGNCTTDPIQVDFLWKGTWADSNVAIKCAPGYVIVDIDPRNDGTQSAQALGLLDTDGMPVDCRYWERTRDSGWRVIYTLPDGLGRGLTKGELAPGIELFFEASQGLVLVAPSVIDNRPYVAMSDTLVFTPAPACIVAAAERIRAECTAKQAARKNTPAPGQCDSTPPPQSMKARYADVTLNSLCNDLRDAKAGTRFSVLRNVACVMGSVCAACNISTTAAANAFAEVTKEWKDSAKVANVIASGLEKGEANPAEIPWHYGTAESFKQAGQLVVRWLSMQVDNGVQESKYGRVSRSTTQSIALAMAEYSQTNNLFGAFTISVRTLQQLTGYCWQTLRKGLDALRADGTLAIVGRDEFAFIKTNGTGNTTGDKRLQARCYVFNLAEIGRQMRNADRNADRTSSTVNSALRTGKARACYELSTNAPITVLLTHGDTFSKLALGRSAGAVLAKLLAHSAGLTDAQLAGMTGLHVGTVGRAVGRLFLHGIVDQDGETVSAIDADSVRAALDAMADMPLRTRPGFLPGTLQERRDRRDTRINAERRAHVAYVQACRDGVEQQDAYRMARHLYNVTRHPNGQFDKIDADGVITPANVTPTPAPGQYANVWPHLVASAQAERDTAHAPTPTPLHLSHAVAVAEAEDRAARRDIDRAERQVSPPAPTPALTDAERKAQAIAFFNEWNAPTPAPAPPAPRKTKPALTPAPQAAFDMAISQGT